MIIIAYCATFFKKHIAQYSLVPFVQLAYCA
nr:MAG TPA: hypothetical protein [Bacteriophage sp.]